MRTILLGKEMPIDSMIKRIDEMKKIDKERLIGYLFFWYGIRDNDGGLAKMVVESGATEKIVSYILQAMICESKILDEDIKIGGIEILNDQILKETEARR